MSKQSFETALENAGFNNPEQKISKAGLLSVMNEISDGIWGGQSLKCSIHRMISEDINASNISIMTFENTDELSISACILSCMFMYTENSKATPFYLSVPLFKSISFNLPLTNNETGVYLGKVAYRKQNNNIICQFATERTSTFKHNSLMTHAIIFSEP